MNSEITTVHCESGWADIYIAGCKTMARHFCMQFCLDGFCVNMQDCDFAYTGGYESGVKIGLINYARFPSDQEPITKKAIELAHFMVVNLHQSSASVVTPDGNYFISRRNP